MGYQNKEEIKKVLVEQYGCDEKSLENKTREELLALITTLDGEVSMVPVDETVGEAEEKVPQIPSMGDYEWHDYVMKHFHKDEIMDGNPTVDGMRRVVESILGRILEINTSVVCTPSENNQYRASVVVSVVVDYGRDDIRKFDGAADAFGGNAEPEYARHALALAETRAEGRALKRILRLRKVISAEEIVDSSKIVEPERASKTNKIVDAQYNFIDLLSRADKADINVEKFVQSLYNVGNIRDLSHEEAANLCNILSEIRGGRKELDPTLKGYDKSWKESFG